MCPWLRHTDADLCGSIPRPSRARHLIYHRVCCARVKRTEVRSILVFELSRAELTGSRREYMAQVLITGANGFVGRHMCRELTARGHVVTAAVRTAVGEIGGAARTLVVGNIGALTDWEAVVRGIDHVVHCAALAHQPGGLELRAAEYLDVNALGTETLARACVRGGVRRFVFLSTVKVLCEETPAEPCTARSSAQPVGIYAISKWEGEELLRRVARDSDLRYSIVRPPLIYGPGVGANFLRLMSWVDRGIPLPFARIANRRSLVSVENLCDLIGRIIDTHTEKSDEGLLVSDGNDLSTPELVRSIAEAMHRRPKLFPVPTGLLMAAARLCGKGEEASRLCGSLSVDISDTRAQFGWSPPVNVRDAIQHTVDWYLASGARVRK